ncbi:MAG: GTP-binding protein [Coriobacteriaceae bacterium]|nr:GTP-binding protein [Coriobacteriaceae bacterium]
MEASNRVEVTLLTGYLGAGKTTILNHVLENAGGHRIAVIVNDIGEVNIDAGLIRAGGLREGDEVIPLTNGCVCCSLAADLTAQLGALAASGDFDRILIEASGVCEPIPIAYNITSLPAPGAGARLVLDNVVAVVDCARMRDEFAGGARLLDGGFEEDDIESLLIQQLEFCTTVVLNKTDLVTAGELRQVRALVRALQRDARLVESVDGRVAISEIVGTGRFDFDRASRSAAWADAMEHPEEHEEPEVLEYAISTFVYERRRPFDTEAFERLLTRWPASVIRAKGSIWFDADPDTSFLFEQAGRQMGLTENGSFAHALPEPARERLLAEDPFLAARWDPLAGDRETRLCLIGRHMDRSEVEGALDACLTAWDPDL